MIDPDTFKNDRDHRLISYAERERYITAATTSLPESVPNEYREFFTQYGDFRAPGFVLVSPHYDPREMYYINTGYGAFGDLCQGFGLDLQYWFPVEHYDGFSYAVHHRLPDGTIEFGSYDFSNQAYYRGPFSSMKEWMASHARSS
ncbi:hypothetical protein [uncultured Corynebacterium sp.]|uniref:hypothetical protein n=1 Tax=uncultured Corynebacterium sp. TaxID=159447 RepID=UPI002594C49F|nr:hypothetical protein [uncultured Corynebacterium sp.]